MSNFGREVAQYRANTGEVETAVDPLRTPAGPVCQVCRWLLAIPRGHYLCIGFKVHLESQHRLQCTSRLSWQKLLRNSAVFGGPNLTKVRSPSACGSAADLPDDCRSPLLTLRRDFAATLLGVKFCWELWRGFCCEPLCTSPHYGSDI